MHFHFKLSLFIHYAKTIEIYIVIKSLQEIIFDFDSHHSNQFF